MTTVNQAAASAGLMSMADLAAMLACSSRHVYRLVERGRMPAPIRLGRSVRWKRSEIEAWIASGCRRVKQ